MKSALHNKSSKTLYIKNLTWNLNSFGEENPINLMVLQVVYDLVITGTVLSNLQTLLDLNLNNLNPQESFFACVCVLTTVLFFLVYTKGGAFHTVPSLSKVLKGITDSIVGEHKEQLSLTNLHSAVPNQGLTFLCLQAFSMCGSSAAPAGLSSPTTSANCAHCVVCSMT